MGRPSSEAHRLSRRPKGRKPLLAFARQPPWLSLQESPVLVGRGQPRRLHPDPAWQAPAGGVSLWRLTEQRRLVRSDDAPIASRSGGAARPRYAVSPFGNSRGKAAGRLERFAGCTEELAPLMSGRLAACASVMALRTSWSCSAIRPAWLAWSTTNVRVRSAQRGARMARGEPDAWRSVEGVGPSPSRKEWRLGMRGLAARWRRLCGRPAA
jgi:hypothetical protein